MNYILEHISEFDRLEKQSQQDDYSLKDELQDFKFKPEYNILDAGCGGGVLSRYLYKNFERLNINACDYSELRLQQAKKYSTDHGCNNINFFCANLEKIPLADNSMDYIICRYVFEYLPNPTVVTNEFKRILKPNGTVILIDLDGVMLNLHTQNQKFNKLLDKIKSKIEVDLFVGRKLSQFLHHSNFLNVKRVTTVHDFQGQSLQDEFINNQMRLEMAFPSIESILGTKEAKTLKELYLEEMDKPTSTLFHNKFIVSAQKGKGI